MAEATSYLNDKIYKSYVTEILKVMAESWGATVNKSYLDLIEYKQSEEKTGDEVALEVITKAGLKVK